MALTQNEMSSAPVVVYIYGLSGCGKTKLLLDVFGSSYGIVFRGDVVVYLHDGGWVHPDDTIRADYLIMTSDDQPDNIPIHMDHIFYIYSAESLKECRSFLESIWGAITK